MVVSVGGKAREQTRAGEHSRDERKWTLRRRVVKNLSVVKTRSVWFTWDKSVGCLTTERTATGVERAWSGCRLSRGTAGTSRSDAKGESPSGQNREASVPMRSTGADRLVRARKAR